jgi:hypothetical protein
MAKVWLCGNGIIAHSCGPVPLAELSLQECEELLDIGPSHYRCALSDIHRTEVSIFAKAASNKRLVRVALAGPDPQHVLVELDEAEVTAHDGWKSGIYLLPISVKEARERVGR